jgi:predicted adenine nucleotide alpha hydrolase (AANH) superfamily ATPase
LRQENINITGFWYNPNIHPRSEYYNRRDTLIEYASKINLPLIIEDEYGLNSFIENVFPELTTRCEYCYQTRLNATASATIKNKFDAFSTTLLISPYQKHEMIAEYAKSIAQAHNATFLYRDFRPLFRDGQNKARQSNLYMQKYCGCIFSEDERYARNGGQSNKTK